jgi:hypothetical protein
VAKDRWGLAVRPINTFDQAQGFREFLTDAFGEGKEVLVSSMTNDGSVYCILNLIACQEVFPPKKAKEQAILKPSTLDFNVNSSDAKSYRGRAVGMCLCGSAYVVDKDQLDFGVVVGGTSLFRPQARLAPSNITPSREPNEYHAWITVTGQVLEKSLDKLKQLVLHQVHFRPGQTTVSSRRSQLTNLGGDCESDGRGVDETRM